MFTITDIEHPFWLLYPDSYVHDHWYWSPILITLSRLICTWSLILSTHFDYSIPTHMFTITDIEHPFWLLYPDSYVHDHWYWALILIILSRLICSRSLILSTHFDYSIPTHMFTITDIEHSFWLLYPDSYVHDHWYWALILIALSRLICTWSLILSTHFDYSIPTHMFTITDIEHSFWLLYPDSYVHDHWYWALILIILSRLICTRSLILSTHFDYSIPTHMYTITDIEHSFWLFYPDSYELYHWYWVLFWLRYLDFYVLWYRAFFLFMLFRLIYTLSLFVIIFFIYNYKFNSLSIAATPRCSGGRYSFPWIAQPYPWYVPNIAEC